MRSAIVLLLWWVPLAVAADGSRLECVVPGSTLREAPAAASARSPSVRPRLARGMRLFAPRDSKPAERPDFSMVPCADSLSGSSAGSTAELDRMTRRCAF